MQSIRIVMRWLAVSLPVCLALVSSTVALASGTTVNGNIGVNQCGGNNGPQPIFTVKLSTNPVMTTTTNSSGAFSFLNVPAGTFTVTPSIAGPSAVFYPATQNITVTTSSAPSVSFQAALGYTVSGTIGYSGSATGRIYVALINNNCGGAVPGVSLASKGAFTIRGVPPGNYSVQAWMDTLGYGVPNAADPSTNVNAPVSFSVSNANVTGVAASLGAPPPVTLSAAPGIQQAQAFSGGAFLFFQPIMNNNGVEMATSYTVQWSTTQTFPSTVPSSQTKTFPAVGSNGTGIWIITGLTNTTPYYFRVRGAAGTSASPWYETSSPLTINPPSGANTVSGAVTFGGTATGPLYTGFYDMNTNKVYVTQVGSKASPPTSPATYSVKVPSSTGGANYIHFGILDNLNLGVIVPGDVADTNGNNNAPVSITGNQTGLGLALPTSAATTALATQYNQLINQNGTNTNYSLQFQIDPMVKQPVNVTLTSASNPNVVVPQDLVQCNNCGGGNGGVNFGIGINGSVPKVGDSYGFAVTYSDGAVGTASAAVTGVLNSLPSHLQPAGAGTNFKPNFSWTDPTNAGNYTYQFQLMDANYNTIWQIPGKNNGGNGFSSSLTSLTWGVAPAGYSGDTPSVSQLSAQEYYWFVQASDSHGNSAQTQVDYYPGFSALTLPSPAAAALPSGTKGVSYTATIAATGGYPCYGYQVSGSLATYGLTWRTNGNCSSPLIISGSPTSSGTVTFSVQVTDSSNNQVSQSYSINIGGGALSLPQPSDGTDTISTLGSALQNAPYFGTLTATGGSAPYTWIVNGATLASSNSPVPVASGNGLTVTNTGSSTLTFGGQPTVASAITLHVTVKSGSSQATGTYGIVVILGPTGTNNSALSGRYSCLTEGFNDSDGSRWASLSSFTAGSGAFSNGVWDENGSDQSAPSTGTLTGSYSINTDNNGVALLSMSQSGHAAQVSEWAIALTGSASPAVQFRAVEFDTSGQHATANCFLDTTSAFAASTFSGNSFAFNMNGDKAVAATAGGNVYMGHAIVGRFSALGGNLSNGIIELAKVTASAVEEQTFTGTYTAPDAYGRSSFTFLAAGGGVTMTVYIVDSNRMFILETTAGGGLLVGNVRTQSGALSSRAALSGPFVIYNQGVSFAGGGVLRGLYSQVIQATSSGNGSIVANTSFQDGAGTYLVNGTTGTFPALTFDTSNPGRATLIPGSGGELYLYFFGVNNAFMLSVDGNGGYNAGWLEKQTAPTISNTALAGTYMAGPLPMIKATAIPSVGEYKFAGTTIAAGVSTGIPTIPGITFNFDAPVNMSYLLASTTYGTITISNGSGGFASCIAISSAPIKLACTLQSDPAPSIFLLQQ